MCGERWGVRGLRRLGEHERIGGLRQPRQGPRARVMVGEQEGARYTLNSSCVLSTRKPPLYLHIPAINGLSDPRPKTVSAGSHIQGKEMKPPTSKQMHEIKKKRSNPNAVPSAAQRRSSLPKFSQVAGEGTRPSHSQLVTWRPLSGLLCSGPTCVSPPLMLLAFCISCHHQGIRDSRFLRAALADGCLLLTAPQSVPKGFLRGQ